MGGFKIMNVAPQGLAAEAGTPAVLDSLNPHPVLPVGSGGDHTLAAISADRRLDAFTAELASFPKRYRWAYRDDPASRDLCVVFSSNAKRHAFQNVDLGTSALHIMDRDDAYFTIGGRRAAESVARAAERAGFQRILYTGSSKGGFGAVLWATLAAKRSPDRLFRSLAFSPQTVLHPFNDRLDFPSYRALWRRAEEDPRVMASLEAHGDLRVCERYPNSLVTLVYGERNLVDRREAGRLFAPQIRKYPVPLRFHASAAPFTIGRKSLEEQRHWLGKLYVRASQDSDLKATLPIDPEEMLSAFGAMFWIPSLRALVQETLALGSGEPEVARGGGTRPDR